MLGWILPFFLFISISAIAAPPLHVVIDPGHGGHDTGATRGSLKEAPIVLKISRYLKKHLQADPRFKVTMTRDSGHFVRLSERAKLANRMGGDLFLSIHANASPDGRAKGMEVYFQNQLPPNEDAMFLANLEHEGPVREERYRDRDELQGLQVPKGTSIEVKNILKDLIRGHRVRESSQFAKDIVRHWSGTRKSRQYSILQAPFFVVSNVNMPSVLLEVGFVSNKRDGKKLATSRYQKQIAQSLYKSLIDFKESMDK